MGALYSIFKVDKQLVRESRSPQPRRKMTQNNLNRNQTIIENNNSCPSHFKEKSSAGVLDLIFAVNTNGPLKKCTKFLFGNYTEKYFSFSSPYVVFFSEELLMQQFNFNFCFISLIICMLLALIRHKKD